MLQTCTRCRSRRIKCDSLLPACANCAKADLECTFRDDALQEDIPRRYIKSLYDRIQELSSQLALPEHNPSAPSVDANALNSLPTHSGQPAYVSMPGTGQYHYLDRSPSSLMATIAFEGLSQVEHNFDPADFSEGDTATPDVSKIDRSLLSPSVVRYLLSRYDRCILRRYDIPRPDLANAEAANLKKLSDLDKFKVVMACAIAASCESYRSPKWKPVAQMCREWANDSFTPIVMAGDSESVTAILLALIYELSDPSMGVSWELLDLAMRVSLQRGWHRTIHAPESPDHVSLGLGSVHSHSEPKTHEIRLMGVLRTIERSLRMIFNRPSMLSDASAPATSDADISFQYYINISEEIYGGGQVYATQGCPFVGQISTFLTILENTTTKNAQEDPVLNEAWLLCLPVCLKHKQCVDCFQEADDHSGKGMRTLRQRVITAACHLLSSVHAAVTAKDDFVPPLIACSRAFIAGCAIVVSITKRWNPSRLYIKELMRCTEILTMFAPHWKGGQTYLQVWNTLTDLLETYQSGTTKRTTPNFNDLTAPPAT